MTDMIDDSETPSTHDDPIAIAILDALASGKALTFNELAQHIFAAKRRPKDRPDAWRRYLTAVKQQALFLARKGRVEIVRKGEVQDPEDFKGIVRVRMAKA